MLSHESRYCRATQAIQSAFWLQKEFPFTTSYLIWTKTCVKSCITHWLWSWKERPLKSRNLVLGCCGTCVSAIEEPQKQLHTYCKLIFSKLLDSCQLPEKYAQNSLETPQVTNSWIVNVVKRRQLLLDVALETKAEQQQRPRMQSAGMFQKMAD